VGRLLDGRYRLVSTIARGGMATVYLATDTRLDRVVAVKVMRAVLADDPEFVERFTREARAAARLNSPDVVGRVRPGQGRRHRHRLPGHGARAGPHRPRAAARAGHAPPAQALALLEPVLRALAAAHAAGLVHRDVKPENLLVSDDGRVKVADFGLARAVETSTLTATTGLLLGTVAYLAPEQVVDGSADPRTDVYAAGIVLWELLTGTPPYESDSPLSVAYRHVNEDVPPPSTVVGGVPPRSTSSCCAPPAATPRPGPPTPGRSSPSCAPSSATAPDSADTVVVQRPTASQPTLVVPRGVPARPARPVRPPPPTAQGPGLGAGRRAAGRRGAGRPAGTSAAAGTPTPPACWGLEPEPPPRSWSPPARGRRRAPTRSSTRRSPPGSCSTRTPTPGAGPCAADRHAGAQRRPDRRTVPELVGQDVEAARAALEASACASASRPTTSATSRSAWCSAAPPAAGEALRPDTPVAVVVSKGLEQLPGAVGRRRERGEAAGSWRRPASPARCARSSARTSSAASSSRSHRATGRRRAAPRSGSTSARGPS
jgi:serine/threonine-protein kinase